MRGFVGERIKGRNGFGAGRRLARGDVDLGTARLEETRSIGKILVNSGAIAFVLPTGSVQT